MRSIGGFLLACSIVAGVAAPLSWAQAPNEAVLVAQARQGATTAAASGERSHVEEINEWTVGITGGPLKSTILRFVVDMAIAFNEPDKLRVLPVVSRGSVGNATDLLYLKGVDLAMTTSDALVEVERVRNVRNIKRRIHYIAPMYTVEINIVARPEIKSLADLEGKKVGFHVKGGATTVTGRILFQRLGINVEPVYIHNSVAYEKMKTGEIAAILHPGGKPNDFLLNLKVEPGFHLLPVDYQKFDDLYLPSTLTSDDYPKLIKPGETIDTIALVALLAVYNWPKGSDRYRRVERFIEALVAGFDKLTKPPFHPKWREVNLWAKVPGWTRYPAMKRVLARADAKRSRKRVGRAAAYDRDDQERLFRDFLKWSRARRQ